jgi:hypothetical protein
MNHSDSQFILFTIIFSEILAMEATEANKSDNRKVATDKTEELKL